MRLFIAIDPSKEVQDYLFKIQKKLDSKNSKLRLVNSFHLTLKFLGDIKNHEELIKNLEKVKFKKFELTISKTGVFPNENYIRVVWVGVKESDGLLNLYRSMESSLEKFKFKKDFNFHPHITLARVSSIKNKTEFNNNLKKIKIEEKNFSVNDFRLYESTMTPEGPIYRIKKKFIQ